MRLRNVGNREHRIDSQTAVDSMYIPKWHSVTIR